MGEPPFPDLKPLGHDLDPDNNDDVDWLLKWAKNAEYEVAALEAALKEAIGQRDRANHAYEIIQEWQAKQSKIYIAAEARAKALEAELRKIAEATKNSAGGPTGLLAALIHRAASDALARPGEPAGGECNCGGANQGIDHAVLCPAARRDGRE